MGKLIKTGNQGNALDRVLEQDLLQLFLLKFDRPHTRRAYKNDIVQFFGTDEVETSQVREITFVDVNKHIQELENLGRKPRTIKRRVAALRGFFEWLIALQVIPVNPAHRQVVRPVRGVADKDRVVTFLTRDQAETLLEVAGEHPLSGIRDKAMLTVMLNCVLRRSEVAAMDYDHIARLGDFWILNLPYTKGGSDQYVKLPDHVYTEIMMVKEHYEHRDGPIWRSVSHVNRDGRLSANAVYEVVRKNAIKAGLSKAIGAHALRHTGCTIALESGATLQQVQAHARHKNIETTMVYVHQRDRLRNSAADSIDLGK